MTSAEKKLTTLLKLVKHKDMYRVQFGIAKQMGHSFYPWAMTVSTMYGGGRTIATIKHVQKHWTVRLCNDEVVKTSFKTRAEALLFIANEMGMAL